MKKIREVIRNSPLQLRLSLPVAVAMALLLLSQWLIYNFCSSVVEQNIRSSAGSAAISVRSHVDTKIRNIIEQMYYTRLDASVEENLTDYLLRSDRSTEAVTNSMLSYSLSLQRAAEPMIASLLIYTPKNTFSGIGIPWYRTTILNSRCCGSFCRNRATAWYLRRRCWMSPFFCSAK